MICLTSEFPPMISTDFSCHSFILFLLVLSLIEAHTGGHTIGSPIVERCLVNFRAVFVCTATPRISWDASPNTRWPGNDTDLKLGWLVTVAKWPQLRLPLCHSTILHLLHLRIGTASHSIYKSNLQVKINKCQRQQSRMSSGRWGWKKCIMVPKEGEGSGVRSANSAARFLGRKNQIQGDETAWPRLHSLSGIQLRLEWKFQFWFLFPFRYIILQSHFPHGAQVHNNYVQE